MDKITRSRCPLFLQNNYKRWGAQYNQLRINNTAAGRPTTFQWSVFKGTKVNILILPKLQLMTQNHCSFCDLKDLEEGISEPTIEHFMPSSLFPLQSYYWRNLFACCYSCQKKGNNYDNNLLKPDIKGYSFDDYFIIDWATGYINERYNAPDVRYTKANITIQLYGLNRGGRPNARLRELKHYRNEVNPVLNEFSYRFFITRA